MLSLDDMVVLFAGEEAADELTYADVVEIMRSICERAGPANPSVLPRGPGYNQAQVSPWSVDAAGTVGHLMF
jgi:hypothetical protein